MKFRTLINTVSGSNKAEVQDSIRSGAQVETFKAEICTFHISVKPKVQNVQQFIFKQKENVQNSIIFSGRVVNFTERHAHLIHISNSEFNSFQNLSLLQKIVRESIKDFSLRGLKIMGSLLPVSELGIFYLRQTHKSFFSKAAKTYTLIAFGSWVVMFFKVL